MTIVTITQHTWPNIKGVSLTKPYIMVGSQGRATTRKVLRDVWNSNKKPPTYTGNNYMLNNFRGAMNAGDPLGRKNYSCGGSNMIGGTRPGMLILTSRDAGQSKNKCDGSDVPASTCNVKYVYDSSDVTRYRKERAINRGYYHGSTGFDYSYGGSNNAAQSVMRNSRN
jgi:hypothetical protein